MEYVDYFLLPGYVYFTEKPARITTILGSCVSICLFDSTTGYAGMNHYVLNSKVFSGSTWNGGESISQLISMFRKRGVPLFRLEAVIIGGNNSGVLDLADKIGLENIQLAIDYLKKYNITIKSVNSGMGQGQKVVFDTYKNTISIKEIARGDT